jgi:hypothetical protein
MTVAELILRLREVSNENLPVLVEVGGRSPDVIQWEDDEHGSACVTLS